MSTIAVHLPVEIWHLILEHMLTFRPFLTIDPAVANEIPISDWLRVPGWGDELARRRAVLRQVCRSWCAFVDRPEFKYQFGKLWTISDPTVTIDDQSVAELMKARRIEGMTSSIVSIRGRNIGAGTREREVTSVRRIWEELLDQEGATFQAEIITHAGPQLSDLIVESNPKAFPHLKSLCLEIYYLNPDPILRGLSNNHPSMRFLSLVGHSTITLSSQGFLRLPFLTTLIITTRIDIGEESVFDKWHLPSLFYLEVGCFRSINCLGRLFEVLAQFGQKLRSLNVTFPRAFTEPYDDRDADLMSRLWDSCPMLRNLRAPLYLVLPHPPPLGHPLEHVVNSDITSYHSGCLVARGWLPFNYTDAVLSFCSATPCLVLIRDSHVWKSSEGPHDSVRGAQSTDLYELMCETALQKEDTGLAARYEDSNGNTLIEWFQWNP